VTPHTVGIVEDDAAIRDSLRLLLGARGISAQCFESAAEFLNSADLDQFGSLLVDQHMPKMTGIELIELLRSRNVTTPAIMITGAGDDRTLANRAKKAGVIAILQKPFAGTELEGWVRLALITGKSGKPTVQ
jgi:FixJ family two-component response regulator